jgi:hypothetical protein
MDWNFDENRPVFMKINKTGGDLFCRLLKIGWSNLIFFKKNENKYIKISKKPRIYFKIFCQNIIKKFEVTRPTKFGEVKNVGKIKKNGPVPYNPGTLSPYPPPLPPIRHPCSYSPRQRRAI